MRKIVTEYHYQDAMQHIDHSKRHLILFDIDDNLMVITDLNPIANQARGSNNTAIFQQHCGSGSDSWVAYLSKAGVDFKTIIDHYDAIQSFVQPQPVESHGQYQLPGQEDFSIHNKLQGLADKGHIILGITSRGAKTAANTEYHLRQCGFRFRDLSTTNIGQDNVASECFEYQDPIKGQSSFHYCHHSIIYCEGKDKGHLLESFLNKTVYGKAIVKKGFDRLFFMDDAKKKCESIIRAAERLNKPATAVHYRHVKQFYQPYDKRSEKDKKQDYRNLEHHLRFFQFQQKLPLLEFSSATESKNNIKKYFLPYSQ